MLRLQFLGFDVIIRNQPPSHGEGNVFMSAKAVIVGADISDLHDCMVCTIARYDLLVTAQIYAA